MTLSVRLKEALSQPLLVAFIFSSFLSNIGTWVQRLTMGWFVFELTASIAWVGIVAACEVLPAIFVQPFGGVLLDRMSRSRTLAIGSFLALVQAAALSVLYMFGVLDLPFLVIAAIMLGLLEGVNQPARLTLVSEFSSRSTLQAAISISSFSFNLARFIAPIIAGIFLSLQSIAHAFAFNAASYLPLIALLIWVRSEDRSTGSVVTESVGRAVLTGLIYVRDHAVLRNLIALALCVNLCCRSLIELLPAISGYLFERDPVALSVLTSSVAFGAMFGGAWILTRREMADILGAFYMMCALNSVFAISLAVAGKSLVFAAIACFGLGLCSSGAAVGLQNIVHHSVSRPYLGRTMALYGLVQRGGSVLGAVLLGGAADILGLRFPLLVAGTLALIITILFWLKSADLELKTELPDSNEM